MFIVAPSTVWNPSALETRQVPKRIFGRVALLPRRGATARFWGRLLFEAQPIRFAGALLPFVAAMLAWPHLALPIAQAPLLMVIVIGLVEMKVLRIRPEAREALASEAEVARVLDALRFRATAILSRIAARRGLERGELHLVVEQSELARVSPLTLVSVQCDDGSARLLDLAAEEREMLSGLFDADLTEGDLQRANLRQDAFLRVTAFDSRGVSAHARLAALMAAAE